MAVAGTVQHGRHYVYQSGRLALHLGACHAAYCEHTKRTAFEGEFPDRKAMRRMIVECHRRDSYVVEANALVCFNGRGDRRRAAFIGLEAAKQYHSIDGFPEPNPDVGTGTGYRSWEAD